MKCLFEMSYYELTRLVERTLAIDNWLVRKDSLSSRLDATVNSERFRILKEKSKKLGCVVDDSEIITWFDTLNLLYYTFGEIKDDNLRQSITILQEYCIPYSNKRADYLLVCDNKILILEFSFNKMNYPLQYETKLHQAIGYKELLGNVLPKEIDIGTYTFLVEAEEDENGYYLYAADSEELANHYKMRDLANYIEKFFNKNKGSALRHLNNIK